MTAGELMFCAAKLRLYTRLRENDRLVIVNDQETSLVRMDINLISYDYFLLTYNSCEKNIYALAKDGGDSQFSIMSQFLKTEN